jgi:hypothetical protein
LTRTGSGHSAVHQTGVFFADDAELCLEPYAILVPLGGRGESALLEVEDHVIGASAQSPVERLDVARDPGIKQQVAGGFRDAGVAPGQIGQGTTD